MSNGITALLFTDIESSTRLWEQDGERMSRALAQHDALSRSAVERHRGTVVKMTGDGMYAAFDDPLDALAATVALQQALSDPAKTGGVELRLRCGVHAGVVERRDEDLFGSAVNRAARIMSAAHGGQVLLSQAVADAVRGRSPQSISLLDLGAVRLRDLATSEHVYQLVHPALRRDFPALRSLEATPNNLPQQVTSFVGRQRELVEAKELLERTRLLTLCGMGGLGKTRLSLQIAADVLDAYPDGVWFIDLAPIKDASLVASAAAQALGVHDEPGKPLVQTLCSHLRDHKALLVLDNCEHLVASCASFADALLSRTGDLRMIATSREALRIRGEQTYPVLPLAVPERNADAETLLRSEAVQLFVERARLQKPGFAVNEREAPAVAELCARLEGIPLALELAAARLRSLSVAEVNKRLHDRFKLLTAGSRVALERQQTLHALVSWSYDLLREQEQILLDRLSVFVGGFDLDAAEAVCGAEPLTREDVMDLVTSLVEKSLVMLKQEDGWSRYGMLETIREFARQHSIDAGNDARYDLQRAIRDFAHERIVASADLAATAARHCDYYLAVAKTAREKLRGSEQAEWTRRIEIEFDNLRAAIALALAGGVDPVIAVKLEVALMRFRVLRGYSSEGRNNIRAALALPALHEPNAARAHALYTAGVLAFNQGDHAESMKALTECLAIRRTLANRREIAATLSTLATQYLQLDEHGKARECEEEALDIFRALGDEIGEGIGLLNLGAIAVREADASTAERLFFQALDIARRIGHRELESECEHDLGNMALRAGDLPTARDRFERALAICREAEDKRGDTIAAWSLARVDAAGGDAEKAMRGFTACLPAFEAFGMKGEALDCLDDVAALLHETGRIDDATLLHAAAAARRESLGLRSERQAAAQRTRDVEALRARLGGNRFDGLWASGGRWTLQESIKYALQSSATAALAA